uniref:Prolyl endopeptidase n=1 Tax=Timema tahoe TaxID=61484 RepID=A0A7R9FP53_9NEOP|nr:unnamed protein product [Timema tahoe]
MYGTASSLTQLTGDAANRFKRPPQGASEADDCPGRQALRGATQPMTLVPVRTSGVLSSCYSPTLLLVVADPYRWLEDPDSPETIKFVEAQNAITRPILDACPAREEIKSRLTQLLDYPRYWCPYKHGEKYYFYKNTGLQNQNVLYVQDTLDSEPRVFVDPNLFSEDGIVSLGSSKFSEDGKMFAYGLSKGGSDWVTIHFRDVETGVDYPDKLEKVKFSAMAWTHDNKGLFYARYPDSILKADGTETEAVHDQKIYYHRLKTDQSEDIMVCEFPEFPRWRLSFVVSDDGEWLYVMPREGTKENSLYYAKLSDLPGGEIKEKLKLYPIVPEMEAEYDYVANDGPLVYIRTNKDAPNYKLITIDLNHVEPTNWKTVLPQQERDVLDWVSPINTDQLVVCYIHDVTSRLQLCDLKTGCLQLTLPLELGTVTQCSGKRKHTELFYQFTSFLTPGIIYHCDLTQSPPKPKVFREIKLKDFDTSSYTTSQVFYPSKDGTKIPMFLVHKKELVKDGSRPALLYGYGGFNISLQPTFSVTRLVFIQHFGGVVAIPNIRGGGEYGEAWHNAGRLHNKQNVFDDFQASAEYLVKEGFTSHKKLIIEGGSNGGLLVGACINQRPELFGAAIAHVGVFDMLRYHKFTIGHAWVTDYGNAEEKEFFETLIKYSPLNNVRVPGGNVQYPATLLLTGDHDDRVVPLHSLKLIATLQETFRNCKKQTNPLVIRVDTKSGHGGGKPITKIIDEHTDIMCFYMQALNLVFKK